jgi:hypothetical protein
MRAQHSAMSVDFPRVMLAKMLNADGSDGVELTGFAPCALAALSASCAGGY